MNKNDIIDVEQYPGLIGLFWDVPHITKIMKARDVFCILALRVEEKVEIEKLNEKEMALLDELFHLFENDIPEVFYNGWKHEKVYAGEYFLE